MQTLLISTGVVALAEMGDKTQLLSFILAARFQKPIPIILGIFVATILNHAMAGALGAWLMSVIDPDTMRWILAGSFVALGLWILVPDKIDAEKVKIAQSIGVFGATCLSFFLAEMGDKTQIATIALGARFDHQALLVIIGTTLGMMLANVPVVYIGQIFTHKIPLSFIRLICAVLFVIFGLLTLLRADQWFS